MLTLIVIIFGTIVVCTVVGVLTDLPTEEEIAEHKRKVAELAKEVEVRRLLREQDKKDLQAAVDKVYEAMTAKPRTRSLSLHSGSAEELAAALNKAWTLTWVKDSDALSDPEFNFPGQSVRVKGLVLRDQTVTARAIGPDAWVEWVDPDGKTRTVIYDGHWVLKGADS